MQPVNQLVLWGELLIIVLLAVLLFHYIIEKTQQMNRRHRRRADYLEELRDSINSFDMKLQEIDATLQEIVNPGPGHGYHVSPIRGMGAPGMKEMPDLSEMYTTIEKMATELFGPNRRRVNIAAELYEIAVDQVDTMGPDEFKEQFGFNLDQKQLYSPKFYAEYALILADELIAQGGRAND